MAARKHASSEGKLAKRPKAARDLTLALDSHERAALIRSYRLPPRTRRKIEASSFEPLRFTKREMALILENIGAIMDIDPDAPRAVLDPLRERVVEALEEDNPEAFGGEYLRELADSPRASKLILQFHIELLNTQPAIWRRIQIADGPLSSLHDAIQGAFDWEECHLHQFEARGMKFGPPTPVEFLDFGLPTEDETKVMISQLLPSTGKQTVWLYTYDFGDDWVHEVLFEGCGPAAPRTKYPLCLEGRRAAPPEDCGGPWGFANILQMLAAPDGERDDEDGLLDWLGPFDPEAFDAQQATKNIRRWARNARPR